MGAPEVRVVVSASVHITVKKALRILGFGINRLRVAPVDELGRIDPAQLPPLDDMTVLCLQAGEVNSGEFDPFAELIPAPAPLVPGCMSTVPSASGPGPALPPRWPQASSRPTAGPPTATSG